MRLLDKNLFTDQQQEALKKLFGRVQGGDPFAREWLDCIIACHRCGNPEHIDWNYLYAQFPEDRS